MTADPVRVVALGGTLDQVSLAVQILVAIGTIGAVGVAMWLSHQETMRRDNEDREARTHAARQVSATHHRLILINATYPSAAIEIANDSDEAIFNIRVEVKVLNRPNLKWVWTDLKFDGILGRLGGKSTYLLAGGVVAAESVLGAGDVARGGTIPDEVDIWDDLFVFTAWHDSRSGVWQRNGRNQKITFLGDTGAESDPSAQIPPETAPGKLAKWFKRHQWSK